MPSMSSAPSARRSRTPSADATTSGGWVPGMGAYGCQTRRLSSSMSFPGESTTDNYRSCSPGCLPGQVIPNVRMVSAQRSVRAWQPGGGRDCGHSPRTAARGRNGAVAHRPILSGAAGHSPRTAARRRNGAVAHRPILFGAAGHSPRTVAAGLAAGVGGGGAGGGGGRGGGGGGGGAAGGGGGGAGRGGYPRRAADRAGRAAGLPPLPEAPLPRFSRSRMDTLIGVPSNPYSPRSRRSMHRR